MASSRDDDGGALGQGTAADRGFCDGDACQAIVVRWDARRSAYHVRNRGDRPVRVRFKTWSSITELRLTARGEGLLHADSIEYPYSAQYDCED